MDTETQHFKLYFLNCRSICNKLGEIKDLLYSSKPHVFCFNETWITRFVPKFRNYVSHWEHRGGPAPGGGLGIVVNSEIAHKTLPLIPFLNGYLEVQAVTVVLDSNQQVNILNLYNPNKAVTADEFQHYISQLGNKYLIVGDFNAHTPLLESQCKRSNFTGRSLETIITDGFACLINPTNMYTYTSPVTGRGSCLDVCLASPSLAAIVEIDRGIDVGSDHITMVVTMLTAPRKMKSVGIKKFIYTNDEDLSKFSQDVQPSCIIQPSSLDPLVEDFTKRLLDSAERNIFRTSGKIREFKSSPWWSKDVRKLVVKRRKARRILEKHPMQTNLDEYKACTVAAMEICKSTKKKSLQEYISTLQHNTPIGSVWKKFRAFQGGYTPATFPIEQNGELVTDAGKKADLLAEHFASISTTAPRLSPVELDETIAVAKGGGAEQNYNQEIKFQELEEALAKPKKTSAGADQIPFFLLRALQRSSKLELLNIFNQSYLTGQVPSAWKIGTVVPILKPGKDPKDVKSYRPITLLSCMSKVLERIIQNRFEYVIENKNMLKPEQCGFRRGLGTLDALMRFENKIRTILETKQIGLVIYIDLKSAFDKVWDKGLVYKLSRLGLRGNMLKWFSNYLSGRKMQVRLNGNLSSFKDIKAGTPQGAVCSPTLFNIMLSDLPDDPDIEKFVFADDITILCSGRSMTVIKDKVQAYLNKFAEYADNWGLEINPQKTFMQLYTRKRIAPPVVFMRGQPVEAKKEQRLLGLIFDAPLLTWRAHIDSLKTQCLKRINIMKSVAYTKLGASSKIIKLFYTAYVRAKIDYGSCLYGSAADAHLRKLEPVQNAGLRMILGAMKSTPILSLQAETQLPPLALRRMYIVVKEFIRIMHRPLGDETARYLQLDNGLENINNIPDKSFLSSAQRALALLHINIERTPKNGIMSIPPWKSAFSYTTLLQSEVLRDPNEFAEYVLTHFGDFNVIYTDGSKITDPGPSVACAIFVQQQGKVICWKLAPEHSVVFAELFALNQALIYIRQFPIIKNWVIFTDSLSSISMIRGRFSSYPKIISDIQNNLIFLNETQNVIIHWVKSHIGVGGNEIADKAANQGHLNENVTTISLSKEEHCSLLAVRFGQHWDSYWKTTTAQTGKGLFLINIREDIYQNVPSIVSDRRAETALHRLRVGHAGLNGHLHRIRVVETGECEECQVPETIEHYLLHCPRYLRQRILMSARLRFVNINITQLSIKLLLGGSAEYYKQRKQILKILIKFLKSTGRIKNM